MGEKKSDKKMNNSKREVEKNLFKRRILSQINSITKRTEKGSKLKLLKNSFTAKKNSLPVKLSPALCRKSMLGFRSWGASTILSSESPMGIPYTQTTNIIQ